MDKWEKRFMDLAALVATWSKSPKHQVGAVITNCSNHVIGLGYNGPPRCTKDVDCNYGTELTEAELLHRTIHAELNAILNAQTSVKGCRIFVWPCAPCAQCAAAIIQMGIVEVVYYTDIPLSSWEDSQHIGLSMFREAGILVQRFK